jgi:hypothetical protein
VVKTAEVYLYKCKSKGRNGIRYVRCVLGDCSATGKIKCEQERPEVFNPLKVHNHGTGTYELEKRQLEVELRAKAASGAHSKESLNQIFRETTRDSDIGENISFGYLESGMLKARGKIHPCSPDSIEDFVKTLKNNDDYGFNFRAHVTHESQEAVIVVSEAAATRMHQIKEINFDGTFFCVPEPFYQLWSILGSYEGRLFPLIGVLMTGRTTELYKTVLSKLK